MIDEIQRLPVLLDEAHRLIEERGLRFLLTGSSARKLRRGSVNLLGGRARTQYLHPLTWKELGGHFDLDRALQNGLLPSIYFSDDPGADLQAYAGTYLQQEIMAEGACAASIPIRTLGHTSSKGSSGQGAQCTKSQRRRAAQGTVPFVGAD